MQEIHTRWRSLPDWEKTDLVLDGFLTARVELKAVVILLRLVLRIQAVFATKRLLI